MTPSWVLYYDSDASFRRHDLFQLFCISNLLLELEQNWLNFFFIDRPSKRLLYDFLEACRQQSWCRQQSRCRRESQWHGLSNLRYQWASRKKLGERMVSRIFIKNIAMWQADGRVELLADASVAFFLADSLLTDSRWPSMAVLHPESRRVQRVISKTYSHDVKNIASFLISKNHHVQGKLAASSLPSSTMLLSMSIFPPLLSKSSSSCRGIVCTVFLPNICWLICRFACDTCCSKTGDHGRRNTKITLPHITQHSLSIHCSTWIENPLILFKIWNVKSFPATVAFISGEKHFFLQRRLSTIFCGWQTSQAC